MGTSSSEAEGAGGFSVALENTVRTHLDADAR